MGHVSINRQKPNHKFTCLPDVVGGLDYSEYTTSLMLTDREPPFTVYSLSVDSPNNVDRYHNMSQRIEDMMMPFETEPCYAKTATGCMCASPSITDHSVLTLSANTTGYSQTLLEDLDEALDSQAA